MLLWSSAHNNNFRCEFSKEQCISTQSCLGYKVSSVILWKKGVLLHLFGHVCRACVCVCGRCWLPRVAGWWSGCWGTSSSMQWAHRVQSSGHTGVRVIVVDPSFSPWKCGNWLKARQATNYAKVQRDGGSLRVSTCPCCNPPPLPGPSCGRMNFAPSFCRNVFYPYGEVCFILILPVSILDSIASYASSLALDKLPPL